MPPVENSFNENTESHSQQTFGLPGNIKQVGSIEKDLKIYMEDYVHTYLFKYAKANASKEKLAVLVGKSLKIDNEDVLIITGALQGKFTAQEKGVEIFTEKSWENFHNETQKFFKGEEVIGWVHTQPGYGAFLMVRDEAYHSENFPKKHQVLFVLDPMEKTDAFFIQENNGSIRKAKGYFIYYDKNENMQEYMLENPLTIPKDNNFTFEDEESQNFLFDRFDAAKRIRDVLQRKKHSLKANGKYNTAVSVSAAFLAVVLIMGAGLIKNNDKINELENKINLIATGQETENVFAASEYSILDQDYKDEVFPEEDSLANISSESEDIYEELSEDEILCYYIVKEGDSLMRISRKYFGNTSMVDRIAEANNIESPDTIYYGKKIVIPKE